MGASGWSYFVPYQSNIEKALQELREDVFRRGEFERQYFTGSDYKKHLAETEEMFIGLEMREIDRVSIKILREFAALGDDEIAIPKTPDEAIVASIYEGTHSIIDVTVIAKPPWDLDGYGIYPISDEDVMKLFGTLQPIRSQIEDRDLYRRGLEYGRWQGFYLIVYKDGKPDEIYFEGASGD